MSLGVNFSLKKKNYPVSKLSTDQREAKLLQLREVTDEISSFNDWLGIEASGNESILDHESVTKPS